MSKKLALTHATQIHHWVIGIFVIWVYLNMLTWDAYKAHKKGRKIENTKFVFPLIRTKVGDFNFTQTEDEMLQYLYVTMCDENQYGNKCFAKKQLDLNDHAITNKFV